MLGLGLLLLLLGRGVGRAGQGGVGAGGLSLFMTGSDPKRVIFSTPHNPAGSK